MLKEIVILIGLLVCLYFFIPPFMDPPILSTTIPSISLLAFIGFLLYGAFHFKWLLVNHGRKYAVLFLVILLVTVFVGSFTIWLLDLAAPTIIWNRV